MLYYDRIDVSEGIDVNKRNESKECDDSHYWYSLDRGFKFQPDVCNVCHDMLMISINLSNISILNIHGTDYRWIFSGIWKSKAIKLMQNIHLTEKSRT